MNGAVFIWLTATRPVASWPEPSPEVSLNHGFCAGALAWVRTQTLCLPASVLMASINSRALLDSPAGAGAFIVTVAMAFLLKKTGRSRPYLQCGVRQAGCHAFARRIVAHPVFAKASAPRAAGHTLPKRHSRRAVCLIKSIDQPRENRGRPW